MRKALAIVIAILALAGCSSSRLTLEDVKDFAYGAGKIAYDSAKQSNQTSPY